MASISRIQHTRPIRPVGIKPQDILAMLEGIFLTHKKILLGLALVILGLAVPTLMVMDLVGESFTLLFVGLCITVAGAGVFLAGVCDLDDHSY